MTGILPNRQKQQRRRFRRCDAKRNTPVRRLSAPCCDFVDEVEEVSLPAGLRGVCGPCEGRLRPWKSNGSPCGYRVENQAGERDGAAWRPRPSSLRPAEPVASRLSAASSSGSDRPPWSWRILSRKKTTVTARANSSKRPCCFMPDIFPQRTTKLISLISSPPR